MAFELNDLGIDLGTSSVLVYVKGRGIILREPSIIAVNRQNGELLAIGEDARKMVGRTPENIIAIRPLRNGVIANFHDTERMLRYYIRKVVGRKLFFKPKVIISVPSHITEVEKRAVIEAAEEAGARYTALIEEPMAAAIGAGVDIAAPYGSMVMDIGGGTSDVAVISLGGIVISDSSNTAGDSFDDALVRYMKKKYNILIGERTAEEVKVNIGSAAQRKEPVYMEVAGRNLMSGLPKTVTVNSNETAEAFEEPLETLFELLHGVLEKVPPELSSDIAENGICMTGGGSLLYGLDKFLTEKTGIQCYTAEDPVSCVSIGAGMALDNIDLYANGTVYDYRRGDYYEG